MRCMSVRVISSPLFVVLNATVKKAVSLANVTRSSRDDVVLSLDRIELRIEFKWLRNIAGACLTNTPACFCSLVVKAMYCVTGSLRTGFPVRKELLQSVVMPNSFSKTTANFDIWFDRRESCAYLRPHSPWVVEQSNRSDFPTAWQCLACTTVRLRIPHETNQQA